jgi:hypothetical protein
MRAGPERMLCISSGRGGVAVDIGMLFLVLLIIFVVWNSIYKGRYGG